MAPRRARRERRGVGGGWEAAVVDGGTLARAVADGGLCGVGWGSPLNAARVSGWNRSMRDQMPPMRPMTLAGKMKMERMQATTACVWLRRRVMLAAARRMKTLASTEAMRRIPPKVRMIRSGP